MYKMSNYRTKMNNYHKHLSNSVSSWYLKKFMWQPHIALIHWCVTVFNSTNCLLVMYAGHMNLQRTWFKLSKRLSLRSKLFPLSDFNKHVMKDASKKTLMLLADEILSKKKKKMRNGQKNSHTSKKSWQIFFTLLISFKLLHS